MSIYSKIKDNYDVFTKSEQRVAKYCLDNYTEVAGNTLSQLAEKAHCGKRRSSVSARKSEMRAIMTLRKN